MQIYGIDKYLQIWRLPVLCHNCASYKFNFVYLLTHPNPISEWMRDVFTDVLVKKQELNVRSEQKCLFYVFVCSFKN